MKNEERICNECPARAAHNCPYENFPHLKRKCEYRSDVLYGYELAQQELELAWEDIKAIVQIADSMLTGTAWDAVEWPDEKEYYEQVLKKFNETKDKK